MIDMTCVQCGADLRDAGIRDVSRVIATADMAWHEDDGWTYTGDTDTYFDCEDHVAYECYECGTELTPAQEKTIEEATP